ncbi:alpha/beta hydrolase fold-domain-containing protein [Ilyonectria sp. MPI-CAGE-AT-0026]|nr:alpha/beta hydrolase fold-domain-containing protein [Ilyonectria sp. MPI-CAGE-AT-0026]
MPVHLADEWLKLEAALGYRPQMSGETVLHIRDGVRLMTKRPQANTRHNPDLLVYDTVIESPHHIKVRVYEPKGRADNLVQDVALFFHGGGWCIGDTDLEDDLVRFMAVESEMKFVSVDYRLAPENPWPAQLEDCSGAAKWAMQLLTRSNLQASGNSGRIFLVGTSAGAQLALSVAIKLSQAKSPVDGIVALAPFAIRGEDSVKYIGQDVNSHHENSDAPIITMEVLQMFLDAAGAPLGDPSFSVLLSPHLSDMPPTYVAACGADILRDHGLMIAETLRKHRVPVRIDTYPGYPHTFWGTPGLEIIEEFRSNLLSGIQFVRNS